MKDASGEVKDVMSVQLFTDLPSGKKKFDDGKVIDEKLVLNGMAEVPEISPLGKEVQEVILSLLEKHKKSNEKDNLQPAEGSDK